MSALINFAGNGSHKRLPGKFLLVIAIIMAVASLYLLWRIWARDPLSDVQDIALVVAGAAIISFLIIFVSLRKLASDEFKAILVNQFFQAVEDPIFFVNRSGKPVIVNKSAQAFIPKLDDSLTDQLSARLLSEDTDGVQSLQQIAQAITEMKPADADLLVRDEHNEMQRLLVSVKPLESQNLCIVRLVDLSLRSALSSTGHHGLSKLIQILDRVPIGLYAVDDKDDIIAINWTLARWLGATPTEVIAGGQKVEDFIISSKGDGAMKEMVDGAESSTQAEEVTFKGRAGQTFYGFLGRVVVGESDDKHKQLRGGLVLREDASEGDWQVALRRSKLLFKRFFEEAPVGIVLVDLDGRISESNRVFRNLVGDDVEDVTSKLMSDFVLEEDREALAEKMAEAISLGDTIEPVELTLKSEPHTVCSLYVGRMEDDQETVFGLMLHFIDVTEQKNLEEQFVQSQKMQAVGQLAGGIAHDFNNLLTAMIGFCDLLLERHRPGDPSFADINQIRQNANRAANLVRQLLAFSRQQRLNPKVLVLTDAIAELSNLLTRLLGEKIKLDIVHERDLWPVKVDQGQFEQVIINLAVNARDAMNNAGELKVKTSNATIDRPFKRGAEVMPSGDYVKIDISDTGCGIPKENLERIFEPFFSTKEVGSGTGLGLSTVYGIIKQTNGFIFVDSIIDQGTTFSLYIPRYNPEDHPEDADLLAKAQAGELTSSDLTGKETILFAEDEDPVRMFTVRALRNKGYEVLAAGSGEAALEMLKEYGQPVDLLITDVMMPGMDGPTLISEVRKIQPDVKVLCISGYSEDALRKKIDDDKEVHFLAKPFSLTDIAAKAKEVISDSSRPISRLDTPGTQSSISSLTEALLEPGGKSAPASEQLPTSEPEAEPEPQSQPVQESPPEPEDKAKEEKGTSLPPAEETEEKKQPTEESTAAETGAEEGSLARILFCDDEDPVRTFSSRALEGSGFHVTGAASGEEALEILQKPDADFDLLITDVMMPGIDGPTLIEETRKIFPDMKYLCISGYSEEALREKVHNNDGVHFLAKPFNLKEISAKAKEILGV